MPDNDHSLGDQSTFGGGGESSLSDIGGLTGDVDLDMEIVDLSHIDDDLCLSRFHDI